MYWESEVWICGFVFKCGIVGCVCVWILFVGLGKGCSDIVGKLVIDVVV